MDKYKVILITGICIFFCACSHINQNDIIGSWIINKATFNKRPISFASKFIKAYILPLVFKNKVIVKFNADSTVDFPGINTDDIFCRWKLVDEKLIISFDTSRFKTDALAQLDSLNTRSILQHDHTLQGIYNFKRDSILKLKNIDLLKVPIGIYTGVYQIKKSKGMLVINSSATEFELLNFDDAIKRELDEFLKRINK